MFTTNGLDAFYKLPAPLLTVYVRTGPIKTAASAAHDAWLKDESRRIAKDLSLTERKRFLNQVERVGEHLRQHAAHERSLVIFAGPRVWEVVPLRAEVENELSWGKPALSQLICLASEHKAYGIVVVDHAGVRFLEYRMGEISQSEEKKFSINTSQWKKRSLGHVMRGEGVEMSRGSQRDLFDKRVENRYARICQVTAQQAAKFCTGKRLAAIFLVGPDKLIEQIKENLPPNFRQPIVLLHQDLARVPGLTLLRHIEPCIAEWERTREAALVAASAKGERNTIGDFDEVLNRLQKGEIRRLVLARGFDPILHRCVQCGWTDRSADPVCPVCGSGRKSVTLRSVLPELARKEQTEIEVVSEQAAEQLKGIEGMVGWLRPPNSVAASRR